MEINGDVQQRHHQKSIYANSTFNYTIPHLIFHGMVKNPASMNSEPLYVIYTPSLHLLKLNYITQEGSFMFYTKSRATMKWWDPQTNKLKHCSTEKNYEHNNKFGKGWSPGYELMLGANTYTLPT